VTLRIAVVGAGPAGFDVATALLADEALDLRIDFVDRAPLPDGMLRHGPAAGAERLRQVSRDADTVLGDSRVTYFGGVVVGSALPLSDLRSACDAVVLTTGAPADLPLSVAGSDSVGVGTVSHVEAWVSGSADVGVDELDLAMDSAVLVGISPDTLRVAEVLCGHAPRGVSDEVFSRLATSKLRQVQVVDPRQQSEIFVEQGAPANLIIRTGLTPVGVVGRNRARALRCVHRPDSCGRVVSEDLRAQLLLRPRAESFCWNSIDEENGHIAHRDARALIQAQPTPGLYVAGWAGRVPAGKGSHAEDAAAVVAAVHADLDALQRPSRTLPDALAARNIEASSLNGWSARAATEGLLDRFAGEGTAPLADYEALVEQVDED
jgi:ferredoxin/flavodoxin---NADP+ reductase